MSLSIRKAFRSLVTTGPTTPPTGERLIFAKSDGWYEKDDAGVESRLSNSPIAYTAKTGSYMTTPIVVTQSTLTIATSGICTWIPFDVGPKTTAFDRIGINVIRAAVAGSAPAVRLGIYKDDGSGGVPGALLLDAGTVTITATGTQVITISQTLVPGRYWLGFLYTHTTVPTTTLQVSQIATGPSIGGPAGITTIYRCWSLSGVSAGAMPAIGAAAPASSNPSIVALRVA